MNKFKKLYEKESEFSSSKKKSLVKRKRKRKKKNSTTKRTKKKKILRILIKLRPTNLKLMLTKKKQ